MLKDLLYEQVARIGKALSSPKRLELMGLLAQGEKTVEALAVELEIEVKLASAHLKVLKAACLVAARREGKFMIYRLTGDDVASLWVSLREVAQEHLLELRAAVEHISASTGTLTSLKREALLAQARRGDIVVIDVRPRPEYELAHLPYARSMPWNEIAERIDELPRDREIVAYCRGPFCLFSEEAVQLLQARGLKARKVLDGVSEWRAAGLPLSIEAGT